MIDLTPEEKEDNNMMASFIVSLNQMKKRDYKTPHARYIHANICILIDKINNYMLTTKSK